MTEYVYNDANGTLASVKHGEGRTLFKLITADEFRAMKESFPHHKEMLRSLGSVRYCKAEPYRDHIWGTLRIPNKNEARLPQVCLLFYMTAQELIFIEDSGELKPWVKSQLPKLNNASTPELLLLQFMQLAVENDILYLSHIEKELDVMEDSLLTDIPDDFFGVLTRHRRKLSELNAYYEQLTAMSDMIASLDAPAPIAAADGWTKSVELEAGEYILKERTDGLSVDGYIMGAVEDIKAVVTAEEASAVKVVNTYKPEPIYSISIPVEKQVKQTGKHMPVADKTFDFALELSVKTGKLDKIEASFNGAPVTDGFALTVKAGETTASGVLTITGPASQMKNLEGKLTEVGSEKETKWTFDGSVYTFAMASAAAQSDAEAAEAIPMPAAIMRGDEQADKALFVNEYKSTEMKVSVVKKWNDKGSEDKRSESVTVQLFYYQKDANGKDTDTLVPYELDGKKVTAVLNEKNGWKCSFDGLDTALTWTVKETNVPIGYYFYVNRSSDGKTVTVTNVYAATQKPKTGDAMMLWSVLALVSGSAAAAAIIFGRKRSRR